MAWWQENPGASLIDLGDGIALHRVSHQDERDWAATSSISSRKTLRPGSDAVRDFRGFVIANDAANFSAGANLMQLLLAAQDEEWDEIDVYIRAFQQMTQAIKFCPRPVVVAPFGFASGRRRGSFAARSGRQAACELYMGLVETGVGLIPAGGGCKEMTLRADEIAAAAAPHSIARRFGGAASRDAHHLREPSRWPRSPPPRLKRATADCCDRPTASR